MELSNGMDKTYFIYHGNCVDGFGSAFAAWRHFKEERKNLIFIPARHGESFPIPDQDIQNSEIYIADFSFPRSDLIRVHSLAKKIVLLDHHKTAEHQLKDLKYCYFDMNRSGAMITWEYFHKNTIAPKLIQYIQDRDFWYFRLPFSREVNAIIQSYPIRGQDDFPAFEKLQDRLEIQSEFQLIVNEGKAILRFQEQFVQLAITRTLKMIHLDGYEIPAVNTSIFESEICEKLLLTFQEAPFVATYYLSSRSNFEIYSLRSRGNFDVSEIAKKFGGGGHAAASGFQKDLTRI
jgi:hypothetical protein